MGEKGWFAIMTKMKERRFPGERLIEERIGVLMLPRKRPRRGKGLIDPSG